MVPGANSPSRELEADVVDVRVAARVDNDLVPRVLAEV